MALNRHPNVESRNCTTIKILIGTRSFVLISAILYLDPFPSQLRNPTISTTDIDPCMLKLLCMTLQPLHEPVSTWVHASITIWAANNFYKKSLTIPK